MSLSAQAVDSLGGTAVDSAGAPVYGALIVARNAQGQPVAHAVSGRRGVFIMTVQNSQPVSLVAQRAGFQALPPVAAPAGARPATFTLPVSGRRVALDGRATKSTCGAPRDSLSDVARLWDAARIVLESTRWRFGREDVVRRISMFERTLATDLTVLSTTASRERDAVIGPPFTSLPPDSIAAVGYVIEGADDASYYAPDAEVMLSAVFAERQCFGVVAPTRERPDVIGLSFKPQSDRAGIKDIGGIFWFDRASLELQKMQYRYTNVPAAYVSAQVGGELSFTLLPMGAWIISRWEIRMPQGVVSKQIAMQHSITRDRRQVVVQSLLATIGEVRHVRVGADAFTIPSPRP